MLPVVALSSPPLPWILMGSSSGNRFPVLASSDINLSSTLAPHPREGAIFRGGKKGTGGLYHEKREQSRWFIYLGNIPDTGMLPGGKMCAQTNAPAVAPEHRGGKLPRTN